MEAYQWIHPAVAIMTLLLLTATALTKMRAKKYFRAHYFLALATVVGVIATLGLAVYTVIRCDCDDDGHCHYGSICPLRYCSPRLSWVRPRWV